MTSMLRLNYFLLVYGPELPKETGSQHEFSCMDCQLGCVQDRLYIPASYQSSTWSSQELLSKILEDRAR